MTLLILAAGLGSRYGSLKQIDAVGPSGETIMDYSIYDARRAGIGKVVFVIAKNAEKEFNDVILRKYKRLDVDYVFQELPPDRIKPLGTGHAVLSGAGKIKEPFVVINADDFYGFTSFKVITEFMSSLTDREENQYGLVGFKLSNTLSENGFVSRAVCEEDEQHFLKSIMERVNISRKNNRIVYKEDNLTTPIDKDAIVSINMWGFTPSLFSKLEEMFEAFMLKNKNTEKEFFLPSCIDELIKSKFAKVKVVRTDAEWFGLTYKEDKQVVVNKIRKLIATGQYPGTLFN